MDLSTGNVDMHFGKTAVPVDHEGHTCNADPR
jgi:hypothetical protein